MLGCHGFGFISVEAEDEGVRNFFGGYPEGTVVIAFKGLAGSLNFDIDIGKRFSFFIEGLSPKKILGLCF